MTREEAIEWFLNSPFYHKEHVPFEMAIEALKAEPVKHGRWIKNIKVYQFPNDTTWQYLCSSCGYADEHGENVDVPYCWHCGAKMDEVEEDENDKCR